MLKRIILLLFLFAATSVAGNWSAPVVFKQASGIQFRWRVIETPSPSRERQLEWEFYNPNDSTLTFNYAIGTNDGETITGRATVERRERKLAGWDFTGNAIASVNITGLEPGRRREEKPSR